MTIKENITKAWEELRKAKKKDIKEDKTEKKADEKESSSLELDKAWEALKQKKQVSGKEEKNLDEVIEPEEKEIKEIKPEEWASSLTEIKEEYVPKQKEENLENTVGLEKKEKKEDKEGKTDYFKKPSYEKVKKYDDWNRALQAEPIHNPQIFEKTDILNFGKTKIFPKELGDRGMEFEKYVPSKSLSEEKIDFNRTEKVKKYKPFH